MSSLVRPVAPAHIPSFWAWLLAALVLTAGSSPPLLRADPFLLADIRTDGASNRGSAPQRFWDLGDIVVFRAWDSDHGGELWASDGTAQGTRRISDICPHLCSSEIQPLWTSEGLLYFNAASEEVPARATEDALALWRLWRTDGTTEGTILLGDVRGVTPMGRSVGTGSEVFLGATEEHGREPWATDGTPGGTRLLRDLAGGPADSSDEYFSAAAVGDHVLFSANTSDVGYELWRTDGTPEGTALVRDILPGTGSSLPTNLVSVGGVVLFVAYDEEHGNELWRSDATRTGTRVLRELVPGSDSAGFLEYPGRAFFLDSGKAYFPAWTDVEIIGPGPAGELPLLQLWVTDGTVAGTRQLTAFSSPYAMRRDVFDPSLPYYTGLFMGSAEGSVFFAADGGIDGRELWVTDGTPSGTRQVADICPGSCPSLPTSLQGFGPSISFTARDQAKGLPELYVSDGTPAGTGMAADVCPGACSPNLEFRQPYDGGLLFAVALYGEFDGRAELWWTGSSPGKAERIGVWEPDAAWLRPSAGPRSALASNGQVLFGLDDGEHGSELWTTRGTAATTTLVRDIVGDGNLGSRPAGLTAVRDRVFFVATGEGNVTELWVTDGTPPGTRQVVEISPHPPSGSALAAISDQLYYLRDPHEPFADEELWVSDGTAAGTRRIAVIPDPRPPMVGLGGGVFLSAKEGLWRADGTTGGVERIEQLRVAPSTLTPWGDELFFVASESDPGLPSGLWKTDGIAGGAQIVLDPAASGVEVLSFPRPTIVGNTLFFLGSDPDLGVGIWASDGTPEGTRLVADLVPGDESVFVRYMSQSSRGLVFTLDGPAEGPSLWRSDGTKLGTVLLRRFVDPEDGSVPISLLSEMDGLVLFTAADGHRGRELWRTDGSVAGTALVAELEPGPDGAVFHDLDVVGDSAFLNASTRSGGRQLWRSDGTAGGTVPLAGRSVGLGFSRFGTSIARAGNVTVFAAETPQLGTELWGLRDDDEPAGPPAEPPPPDGPWLRSPEVPGFEFKVRIAQGTKHSLAGSMEPECIPETLCVSGALAGRSEAFLRVVGPKPNGWLWPTLVKFSTSEVDIWIRQDFTDLIRHYRLDGVAPGESELTGLFDREGYLPIDASEIGLLTPYWTPLGRGVQAEGSPPPPDGAAFTSPELPGFLFHVRISVGPDGISPVRLEERCISETVCVSGALPGRSELFLRVVGPKPNGRLWPTLARFTTSKVEVWIEQLSSGEVRYYRLEGSKPGGNAIPGLFDRTGFVP